MEEERKKLLFVFVFSTYLIVFLLKFQSGELIGCGIKFRIQRVPTRHTLDGPRYPRNKKYLKKWTVFLLKFWSGELIGCEIKFRIQRVPTWHTFDRAYYPKNKKYLKKCDEIITFFQVFLVFGVAGSVKSMPSGYSLDEKFSSASNELSRSKFE